MVAFLERRVAGRRVLEVGCGTGLLSCVAARLGAARVYAVESTELAHRARELVEANGLQDIVTVLHGTVEEVQPASVDIAFSELLNADPYAEGVLPAMEAAARWVVPGGRLAPHRLRVHVALAWADEAHQEHSRAIAEVTRICSAHLVDPTPLLAALNMRHPVRFTTAQERAVSSVALAFDHALGTREAPDHAVVEVRPDVDGDVGGALVWFSAELDDDLWMSNPPGHGSHWGQMVCAWRAPLTVRAGSTVRLEVRRLGRDLTVVPVH